MTMLKTAVAALPAAVRALVAREVQLALLREGAAGALGAAEGDDGSGEVGGAAAGAGGGVVVEEVV